MHRRHQRHRRVAGRQRAVEITQSAAGRLEPSPKPAGVGGDDGRQQARIAQGVEVGAVEVAAGLALTPLRPPLLADLIDGVLDVGDLGHTDMVWTYDRRMTADLLVRGGTVVDGTGAPARPADVRVRDGVIVEIGAQLVPDGEPEIDAGGAYVAPGFIDCHTHYDPSMWWDPLLDPMPQHGVTTVVTGNCSLSLTPVRAHDRVGASDVFGFIEDIPLDAFSTGIPWTWESYAEWRDALAAHGTAVNIAALVGHSNLRTYVMGDEAWDRAATPEE